MQLSDPYDVIISEHSLSSANVSLDADHSHVASGRTKEGGVLPDELLYMGRHCPALLGALWEIVTHH